MLDPKAHAETLQAITLLYENRVGDAFDESNLVAIHKEGNERFSKRIPPGYMDESKDGDRKYGDLVLWRQILEYGSTMRKPLIFITDDAKEDWWLKSAGKTIGPRPELIDEYYDSSGKRVHFYLPRQYLRFASERGEQISTEAIAEAKSVSTARDTKSTLSVAESYSRLVDALTSDQRLAMGAVAQASWAAEYAKLSEGPTMARILSELGSPLREYIDTFSSPAMTRADARQAALISQILQMREKSQLREREESKEQEALDDDLGSSSSSRDE